LASPSASPASAMLSTSSSMTISTAVESELLQY
jgi:hypothetical protein